MNGKNRKNGKTGRKEEKAKKRRRTAAFAVGAALGFGVLGTFGAFVRAETPREWKNFRGETVVVGTLDVDGTIEAFPEGATRPKAVFINGNGGRFRVAYSGLSAADKARVDAELGLTAENVGDPNGNSVGERGGKAKENDGSQASKNVANGVRRAVLIGVDEYEEFGDLRFAGADVELIRSRLLELGFAPENVVALTTAAGEENADRAPTKRNIERELKRILAASRGGDMIFVMLSGHGFQVEKYDGFEPYVGFAPADAKASVETGVEFASSISLSRFFAELKDCDATFKWALIDACRENLDEPSPDSQMRTRGAGGAARAKALRELEAPRGVAIMQSCGAGEFSWEDAKYGHGLFARAFAESLTELGDANQDGKVTFLEASTRTIREVKTETETNRERYATVQRPYLSGDLTDFVLTEVETSAPKAGARRTATIGGVEFAFRFCPANEGGAPPTRDFWILETEATQAMWTAATGENPSRFSSDVVGFDASELPVESATWGDCENFIAKLNESPDLPAGFVFRLPTEAEWERAALAGGESGAATGVAAARTDRPSKVGERGANAWGVADAFGNVWELCATEDGEPVWRGGGWRSDGESVGPGARRSGSKKSWGDDAGVRPVLVRKDE